MVRSLINDSDWVRRHQHIFLVGPTGWKTFLAKAFGQKACRDGFTAYFATAAQLFRELELARADGSYAKRLRGLGQVDVLIVDDWAMSPLAEGERRAFLEICDERYLTRSTLLTSGYRLRSGMRRSATPRWPIIYSGPSGACGARIELQESPCARRRADAETKVRSKGRMAKWFRALTPVALRAPSVSALNHKRPAGEQSPIHHHKEKNKSLDGCRSLSHTKRKFLRRFAPI